MAFSWTRFSTPPEPPIHHPWEAPPPPIPPKIQTTTSWLGVTTSTQAVIDAAEAARIAYLEECVETLKADHQRAQSALMRQYEAANTNCWQERSQKETAEYQRAGLLRERNETWKTMEALEAERDGLKGELEVVREELKSEKNALVEARDALEKERQEAVDAKTQLETEREERAKADSKLTDELKAYEEEYEALKNRLETEQQAHEVTQRSLSEAVSSSSNLQTLIQDVEKKVSVLTDMAGDTTPLAEPSPIEDEEDVVESLVDVLTLARTYTSGIETQLVSLRHRADVLPQQEELQARINEMMEGLEVMVITRIDHARGVERQRNEAIEETLRAEKEMDGERRRHATEVDGLVIEIESLRIDLKEAEEENTRLAGELTAAKASGDDLKESLVREIALQEEISRLEKQVESGKEDLQNEIDNLKKQIADIVPTTAPPDNKHTTCTFLNPRLTATWLSLLNSWEKIEVFTEAYCELASELASLETYLSRATTSQKRLLARKAEKSQLMEFMAEGIRDLYQEMKTPSGVLFGDMRAVFEREGWWVPSGGAWKEDLEELLRERGWPVEKKEKEKENEWETDTDTDEGENEGEEIEIEIAESNADDGDDEDSGGDHARID